MCSLAPRLTSTALEGRIHVHTLTEVDAITGPPGEFTRQAAPQAPLRERSLRGLRRVRRRLPGDVPERASSSAWRDRTAISRPFAGAVPATFAVEKKGWSPCKSACAVHTSAQGYVALIAAGRFEDAYRVASEPNPFSSVCGRICTHLCETVCARGDVDAPIAIASLKRFVADTVGPAVPVPPAPIVHAERVAIVGAGPTGLTCARDLAHLGYQVTVFEALPVAGGMLRTGIPDYRLPHDVIQREIDQVLALGVELKLGQRAGVDFTVDGLFDDGYQGRLPGHRPAEERGGGAARRRPAGRDPSRRAPARAQPRRHAAGRREGRRHRRRRRGARRCPQRHPPATAGRPRARRDAHLPPQRDRDAGQRRARSRRRARRACKVEFLVQPLAIVGRDDQVAALKLCRCELGDADASGRRQPVAIAGSDVRARRRHRHLRRRPGARR